MKLLKNFFTLVMVFTLIACSSDDDSVPYELNNTNLSTGSYGIQYLNIFDTETVNINGLDIVTCFILNIYNNCIIFYNFSCNGYP